MEGDRTLFVDVGDCRGSDWWRTGYCSRPCARCLDPAPAHAPHRAIEPSSFQRREVASCIMKLKVKDSGEISTPNDCAKRHLTFGPSSQRAQLLSHNVGSGCFDFVC